MPETPASDSAPTAKAAKPKTGGFPQSSTSAPALSVPTIAALALAVIGIVLAIFGWFYPSSTPKYSAEQTAEAKDKVCAAQETVRRSNQLNTNMRNPLPGEILGDMAVGTSARLALLAGGTYLHQSLESNPATPADLAAEVAAVGDTLEALSVNYLAGHAPNDEVQQPLRDQLGEGLQKVFELCKSE